MRKWNPVHKRHHNGFFPQSSSSIWLKLANLTYNKQIKPITVVMQKPILSLVVCTISLPAKGRLCI